ncbi:hypothetical protein OAJ32_02520 [bacterium]|nr:hypothetical protein [bacterium]
MKLKYFIYLASLSLIVIYFSLGFVYFNWYHHGIIKVNSSNFKSIVSNLIVERAPNTFSRLYSLNTPFLSTQSDYKFIFSEKDKFINDSLLNSAIISEKYHSFSDSLRIWRKAEFISPEGNYKIKYKFHGTSLSPFKKGFASFKIKSKFPVNGLKSFRLYSSMEGPYIRVFINNIAKNNGLICEGIGSYLSISGYKGTKLYLQSSGFSDDYLKTNYNIENPVRFKSSDSWFNQTPVHVNNLDGTGYAIEWNGDLPLDTVEKNYLRKFIKIRSGDQSHINSHNFKYFGRYLALLYFFGHPHQVTGDNDTWINFNKNLLPIYRNEGHIDALNFNKFQLDNNFWDVYLPTKTLDSYKKLLLNDSVKYYRDQTFEKIVSDRDLLISQFDSVFEYHNESFYKYDENYYLMKKKHQIYKENIQNNINLLSNYLEVTELAAFIDKDSISVSVDSYVNIDVIINDILFSVLKPRKYTIINEQIVSTIINHKLYFPNEVEKIIFRNSITKDTINDERLILIY